MIKQYNVCHFHVDGGFTWKPHPFHVCLACTWKTIPINLYCNWANGLIMTFWRVLSRTICTGLYYMYCPVLHVLACTTWVHVLARTTCTVPYRVGADYCAMITIAIMITQWVCKCDYDYNYWEKSPITITTWLHWVITIMITENVWLHNNYFYSIKKSHITPNEHKFFK